MSQLLGERLSQQANRDFVGRENEIANLLHLLFEQNTPVIFVHGIGGIGKSSLLGVLAEQAQSLDAVVIKLDCRAIKPTHEGFLHELSQVIGGEAARLEQIAQRLSGLGKFVILALDTYEVFRMMDTWLRQVFIPLLPDNVHLMFFGREAPASSWDSASGWHGLFQSIQLGPLSNIESEELLLRFGVLEADTERVTHFTQGHPLALKLAAATIVRYPDLDLKEVESQHVVTELTQLYLADVPDPVTRTALEAASVVRRTTRSLLSAMLPDVAPAEAYDRLESLPFVESASDGLMIHELIQQAIVTHLRAADPERYHNYRRAAWQQLRKEFTLGSRATIWRYTADMIYLVDGSTIHNAFFPSGNRFYSTELATPNDLEAIRAITLRHDGPDTLNVIESWWERAPEAFCVARDRQSEVVGFYCMLGVKPHTNQLQFDDPITAVWWQHLQTNPIPDKQSALFLVKWLTVESGDVCSTVLPTLWMDIKRAYLEYAQTRRVYSTFQTKSWIPVLEELGFRSLDSVRLDSKDYCTMVNDFGPQLVPGWMAGLVDRQLGIAPSVILNVDAHELVLDNTHIGLTPLEFNLMNYLVEHTEKAISRDELLNAVWGYDYNGGSNVVDAMIRTLRKKLANNAQCIETVAGVGYRLRWSN